MSTGDIIFLSAIICGFAIFAITLAWVERKTAKVARPAVRPAQSPQIWKKAA